MYGTPIDYMTKKMLQNICRNEQIVYSAITTNAGLVALIEA